MIYRKPKHNSFRKLLNLFKGKLYLSINKPVCSCLALRGLLRQRFQNSPQVSQLCIIPPGDFPTPGIKHAIYFLPFLHWQVGSLPLAPPEKPPSRKVSEFIFSQRKRFIFLKGSGNRLSYLVALQPPVWFGALSHVQPVDLSESTSKAQLFSHTGHMTRA